MRIWNQKENSKRLKKILQLRKYLKQEQIEKDKLSQQQASDLQKNSLKKESSTLRQLASQATIQEDYSESQTSLVMSQKKISFESDYNYIAPQKKLSSQLSTPNRVASMSFDVFKQSSDSKGNQSSDLDQSLNFFDFDDKQQENYISNTKEPKSAKTPEKKSLILFRYQKYHNDSFQIEIPSEYLKYIIPAYQEYNSVKKSYNKWLCQTKQGDLKFLTKEALEKNKWTQIPDVVVRIPFDKVESNPQQNEEW